ncbi:MAG: 2OG-Fe(II) oxygenase [Gammaproteobacteria bacterium]|jgi:hypothetical protein|nr:2OG-Fe(II) oxygenase [Gammaproteobacteria bacterium]
MQLADILDLQTHPINDLQYQHQCRQNLRRDGALIMSGLLRPQALAAIRAEGLQHQHLAYYTQDQHNVYLLPQDLGLPAQHPRNRLVDSSKGCITDDQIPADSPLRIIYNSQDFKAFLAAVLEEPALYPYADPLSSINTHYASAGQELGWHFDNSSFAITLLIEKPTSGGEFEYIRDLRDADAGEMNYQGVADLLAGKTPVSVLPTRAGDLAFFRGRNSIHRVTPTAGDITRMLVVLAYNSAPDISLCESARMTFYGRLN